MSPTTVASSPEAAQALLLMPVPLRDEDWDLSIKVKPIMAITFRHGFTKYSYLGRTFSGREGTALAIPHAMETELAIRRMATGYVNLPVATLATGLLASLTGIALAYGAQVFDDNVANLGTGGNMSFKDFILAYVAQFGTDQDRQNQLEGLAYVKKPPGCQVTRWNQIFFVLNEAVDYCRGSGTKLVGANYRQAYFKSFSKPWQDAFLSNGSQNLHTATVQEITAFMLQREGASFFQKVSSEALRPFHKDPKQHTRKRLHESKYDNDEDEVSETRPSQAKKNGTGKVQFKNGKNGSDTHIQNQCRTCPKTVPAHPWSKCPYNPRNPNNALKQLQPDANGNDNQDHNHSIFVDVETANTGFDKPEPEPVNTKKPNKESNIPPGDRPFPYCLYPNYDTRYHT